MPATTRGRGPCCISTILARRAPVKAYDPRSVDHAAPIDVARLARSTAKDARGRPASLLAGSRCYHAATERPRFRVFARGWARAAQRWSGRHLDNLAQLQILIPRTRPDQDFDAARFQNPALLGSAPMSDVSCRKRQCNAPRLPDAESQALERLQRATWPVHLRVDVMNVELHHLVAGARPHI